MRRSTRSGSVAVSSFCTHSVRFRNQAPLLRAVAADDRRESALVARDALGRPGPAGSSRPASKRTGAASSGRRWRTARRPCPSSSTSTNRRPASRPSASTIDVPAGSAKGSFAQVAVGADGEDRVLPGVGDDQFAAAVAVDVAEAHALIDAAPAGVDVLPSTVKPFTASTSALVGRLRPGDPSKWSGAGGGVVADEQGGAAVGVEDAEAHAGVVRLAGPSSFASAATICTGKSDTTHLPALASQSRVWRTLSLPMTTSR